MFITSSVMGQVTETFTAGTGANYAQNLTKVDWNWARMWVEENTTSGKITHGINVFSVADVVSQEVSSATFNFSFEKITTGALPATVEIYYKTPYTGYKWGEVNYPEGCTVLGTVDITEAPQECSFSNAELSAFVKRQIDAGEDAVLFIRTITPDVKLSIKGSLGYPTLDVDFPAAVAYAPSASIRINGTATKDYYLAAKDTVILDFTKPMNTASVEGKFMVEPAATSSEFTWMGDTMAYVVCSGLTKMEESTFTVMAGAMDADGAATKSDASNSFYVVSDNVIKTESNFWTLDNGEGPSIKTNALSVANSDSTDVFHARKAFMYLDLAGTTSETDFIGIMIKCFDQQDANGWVKGPIGAENTDYVLYDVDFETFGTSFATASGMTKIDDIMIDSTYTVYNFNTQAVLDYLSDNAGDQVCLAVIDETPTVSAAKPTIWISDPSNKPDQGAPVVLYDNEEAASLSATKSQQVSLYPQPVNGGEFTITGVEVRNVEVFSVVGRKMTTSLNNNKVDVSGLNSGIYFVRMDTNEGNFVKQILID